MKVWWLVSMSRSRSDSATTRLGNRGIPVGGCPVGCQGLPAGPLRDQRPDLRGGHRGRHRSGSVKFKRTLRIVRRAVGPAFPPNQATFCRQVMADITRQRTSIPTAAIPASSSAVGATATESRNPTTTAPGTAGHLLSGSPIP